MVAPRVLLLFVAAAAGAGVGGAGDRAGDGAAAQWRQLATPLGAGAASAGRSGAKRFLPRAPYRMWSFSYNLTADLYCNTSADKQTRCFPSVKVEQQLPSSYLHPPGSYNLANPAQCDAPEMRQWLAVQGVACMEWSWCWDGLPLTNGTNDSSVIAEFKHAVLGAANASGAIGMDECGELPPSLLPGHDRTGTEKMALAAEGFRQAKKEQPDLFFAALELRGTGSVQRIDEGWYVRPRHVRSVHLLPWPRELAT